MYGERPVRGLERRQQPGEAERDQQLPGAVVRLAPPRPQAGGDEAPADGRAEDRERRLRLLVVAGEHHERRPRRRPGRPRRRSRAAVRRSAWSRRQYRRDGDRLERSGAGRSVPAYRWVQQRNGAVPAGAQDLDQRRRRDERAGPPAARRAPCSRPASTAAVRRRAPATARRRAARTRRPAGPRARVAASLRAVREPLARAATRSIASAPPGARPQLVEADVVLAPALRARPVAGGERGRLVEEEQLGELPRLHQRRAVPAAELEPAGDPAPRRRSGAGCGPCSSCRQPRLPYTSPRSGVAISSPSGVTRFCGGIVAPSHSSRPDRRSIAAIGSDGSRRVARRSGTG